MSRHSSDSEDSWTLVTPGTTQLTQTQDDGGSSSDFVDLGDEEGVVSYHHHHPSDSPAGDAPNSLPLTDGAHPIHVGQGAEALPLPQTVDPDHSEAEQSESASTCSSYSLDDSSPAASEVISSTSSIEELALPSADRSSADLALESASSFEELETSPNPATVSPSDSEIEVLSTDSREKTTSRGMEEEEEEGQEEDQGEEETDGMWNLMDAAGKPADATERQPVDIQSPNEAGPTEAEQQVPEGAVGGAAVQQGGWEVLQAHAAIPRARQLRFLRQISDGSDSDHSDFVRLDPAMAEEVDPLMPEALQEEMHSSHSSNSSGSSIGHGFRFVHPRGRHYEDDDDSIPSDVDDRCESDISGVAADESDLSNMSCEFPMVLDLTVGNVPRSYKHRPNPSLNSLLNTVALLALCLALGIGIGHYMGTVREARLGAQQVVQMKALQDDYIMCLRQQEIVETHLQAHPTVAERLEAVASVWRGKYEELIIEKADLEQRIKQLEKERLEDLGGVQERVFSHRAEIEELQRDLRHLHQDANVMQASHREQASLMEQVVEQRALVVQQQMDLIAAEQNAVQLSQELETAKEHVGVLEQEKELDRERQGAKMAELNQLVKHYKLQLTQYETQEEQYAATVTDLTVRVENLLDDINSRAEDQAAVALELVTMKEELNQVHLENIDLRDEVSRLRYTEHPANALVDPEVAEHALKNQVNELANENEALKSTVGKLRYTPHPGNEPLLTGEEDVLDKPPASKDQLIMQLHQKLAHVNNQLEAEHNRSEALKMLYLLQQQRVPQQGDIPSFTTCLAYLLPDLNLTLSSSGLYASVSSGVQQQWEFLQKMRNDSDFLASLHSQWQQLQASDHLLNTTSRVLQIADNIQGSIAAKWKEYVSWTSRGGSGEQRTSSTFSRLADTVKNLTQGETFQEVFNKTKQTVSQLTESIQDTWNQVQNLSANFLDRHPTVKKVGEKFKKVGQKVQKVGQKVGEKMQKLGKKASKKISNLGKKLQLHTGWFAQEDGPTQDHNDPGTCHDPQHQFGPTHRRPEAEPLNSADIDDSMSQNSKKQFESRSPYKQSSSQEYEEFWKQSEFNPDDILQEGFFEGNNREWRKQQNRFRKLHGRIQRLTEDMITSMDDDDLDDIYDDLDDFDDDMEDEPQPASLKMWLTCQLRWWKSRLHRKHRTEDLVKGCGRQLMKWQLRALCKPKSCHSKKCQKAAKRDISGPFCQYYSSVINAQGECNHQQKDCRKHGGDSGQNLRTDTVPKTANDPSNFQGAEDEVNNAKWYFEMAQDRENHHHDASWYIRAMYEDHPDWLLTQGQDANGNWMFDRAAERAYERNKPWYFKRAEEREQLHNLYQDLPKWGRD